jgi:hypothetical protein
MLCREDTVFHHDYLAEHRNTFCGQKLTFPGLTLVYIVHQILCPKILLKRGYSYTRKWRYFRSLTFVFAVVFKTCLMCCDDVYSDRNLRSFGGTRYLHLEDEVTGFFLKVGIFLPEFVV